MLINTQLALRELSRTQLEVLKRAAIYELNGYGAYIQDCVQANTISVLKSKGLIKGKLLTTCALNLAYALLKNQMNYDSDAALKASPPLMYSFELPRAAIEARLRQQERYSLADPLAQYSNLSDLQIRALNQAAVLGAATGYFLFHPEISSQTISSFRRRKLTKKSEFNNQGTCLSRIIFDYDYEGFSSSIKPAVDLFLKKNFLGLPHRGSSWEECQDFFARTQKQNIPFNKRDIIAALTECKRGSILDCPF